MDVTPGQREGGHNSSQSARKDGRWDVHSRMGMDDWQVYEEDEHKRRVYNNKDLKRERKERSGERKEALV